MAMASLLAYSHFGRYGGEGWTKHTSKLLVASATAYGEAGRLMSAFWAGGE